MKWFLVLISMQLYNDGSAEHFVLTDPTFESLGQCQSEAVINKLYVEQLAKREFGGPANIYCFEEQSLIAYFQQNGVSEPKPTTKKQEISY